MDTMETSSTNTMDPPQPVIDVDLAHPATPINEGQEQSEAATNSSTPDNDIEMATGSTAVNDTVDTTVDEGEINFILRCSVLV